MEFDQSQLMGPLPASPAPPTPHPRHVGKTYIPYKVASLNETDLLYPQRHKLPLP